MAVVGDRVEVPSKRVGQAPREGVVTGVSGGLLRVTWSGGEESTITPSMGSLVVVGRVRAPTKKRASPVPVASKKASSKKASSNKAARAPTKAPSKKVAKAASKEAAGPGAKKAARGSAKAKGAGASKSSKRSGKASKRRK